jgi:hypothetical protein
MKRLQQSFSTLRRSPSGNAAADSARGSSSVQGTHSASGSNAGISLRQNVEGSQVNIHPREGAPGSPVQRNSASPQSTILASPKETILAVNQQTNVRVNQMYASVLPANVCAVCQELFGPGNIPKIAHCCHSICGKCISILPGHWCPHCAPGIVEKVEATPTNWILLGSIDVANLQQGKPRQCDLCDEESGESVAVVHCSTCNMMICQVHGLAHQKSKDTKQHKLRAFSQLVAELQRLNPSELRIVRNLKQLLCPAHDQRCDTWCAICEEVVCVECVVLNHREHSIYQVNDDVYRTQSQELRTKIVRTQERQEDVKAALTNVSVVIESLNRNAATAESAADFAIDAAIRELENRRANLKSTISDIHAEKRRTLDAQQLYLQKCMVRFQTSVDFGKQLLEQEDQSRVLSIKKFVSTSLSETQRCVDPQMWKPCQDDFIAYRDVGLKTVAEAIACLGHVIGENLRDRAYICKWDSARRGQDVVLVNNDTTAYRVDKMGWYVFPLHPDIPILEYWELLG